MAIRGRHITPLADPAMSREVTWCAPEEFSPGSGVVVEIRPQIPAANPGAAASTVHRRSCIQTSALLSGRRIRGTVYPSATADHAGTAPALDARPALGAGRASFTFHDIGHRGGDPRASCPAQDPRRLGDVGSHGRKQ